MYQAPAYLAERPRLPAIDWTLDWYLAAHRAFWNDWEQAPEGRTWRASSLGNCQRQQTLQRRGIAGLRQLDAKTIRTFAWGDEVHHFVRKVFWRLGLVVSEEPTFKDANRDLTGHVDLIWNPAGVEREHDPHWSEEWEDFIDWLRPEFGNMMARMYDGDDVPNVLLGMELKSAHSRAMQRIMDEGPYEHHRIQAAAYMLMRFTTGEVVEDDGYTWQPSSVQRWHIAYVGKDSTGMLAFEVEEAWVEQANAVLDSLNRYWAAGTLPPCTCTDWQVRYCDYNEGDTCCGRNLKGKIAKEIRTHA
jgi:hypothetical protein